MVLTPSSGHRISRRVDPRDLCIRFFLGVGLGWLPAIVIALVLPLLQSRSLCLLAPPYSSSWCQDDGLPNSPRVHLSRISFARTDRSRSLVRAVLAWGRSTNFGQLTVRHTPACPVPPTRTTFATASLTFARVRVISSKQQKRECQDEDPFHNLGVLTNNRRYAPFIFKSDATDSKPKRFAEQQSRAPAED
jgi:hypothetical protein